MKTRLLLLIVAGGTLIAALAYLRDPPWLLTQVSGVGPWETERDGTRFRWTRGHVSFFVPSEWRAVEIPLRATFASPADWPIAASISVDDRPADHVGLDDERWRRVVVRLPRPGSRRARRIDIRLSRMRDERHGIQLGEVRRR